MNGKKTRIRKGEPKECPSKDNVNKKSNYVTAKCTVEYNENPTASKAGTAYQYVKELVNCGVFTEHEDCIAPMEEIAKLVDIYLEYPDSNEYALILSQRVNIPLSKVAPLLKRLRLAGYIMRVAYEDGAGKLQIAMNCFTVTGVYQYREWYNTRAKEAWFSGRRLNARRMGL